MSRAWCSTRNAAPVWKAGMQNVWRKLGPVKLVADRLLPDS